MDGWVRAARVVRTKNLEGSVVCCAADGLPFLLEAGHSVRFVPPTLRGPRGACVEDVQPVGDHSWEVRFEGIGTIDDAQQLVGCTCLLQASVVPEAKAASAFDQMIGCTLVESTHGSVGEIVEVRPGPAQSLLVVQTADGKEVLVPAVDAFLGPIEHDARQVHATLPPGLLDL